MTLGAAAAFGLHAFMMIFGSCTRIIYTLIADSL